MPERRITETDLILPALRLAAARTNGEITTSTLIDELVTLFNPTGRDAEILADRNDTYFSQKVRNLVSHRKQPRSFVTNGYAEYSDGGIRITQKGRQLLTELEG